jgi:hypothetical protein
VGDHGGGEGVEGFGSVEDCNGDMAVDLAGNL